MVRIVKLLHDKYKDYIVNTNFEEDGNEDDFLY